jgi:predicted nucleotidyltransferase component of viral defense system
VSATGPRRRWRGAFDLADLLEGLPGGTDFAVRDFALVTLAGELSAAFPGQLVFKGGFVLRHVHGHLRFSKDVAATRHAPPSHKLEADAVAEVIRNASIQNIMTFVPGAPATDSARSLDFDRVRVGSTVFPDSEVQVEVSYREAVVGTPVPTYIGHPFYEPFEILTMESAEMAAEKLRALAQRLRETDLADLAVLLAAAPDVDAAIAGFAEVKFELVKQGRANRIERIERHLRELGETYGDVVPRLFPGAPTYEEALSIVWPRIKQLIP